jgi:hypothetical protein
MVRDLLQAFYPGDPMPDRPLDTIWEHLLDQVRQQETRYHALAASAVRDREEVKALRAVSPDADGLRLPDDAAERVALWLFRVKIEKLNNPYRAQKTWSEVLDEADRDSWRRWARKLLADLGPVSVAWPADAHAQIAQCLEDYWTGLRDGERTVYDETAAGQAHEVLALVRSWLSVPAVDPAPADGPRERATSLDQAGGVVFDVLLDVVSDPERRQAVANRIVHDLAAAGRIAFVRPHHVDADNPWPPAPSTTETAPGPADGQQCRAIEGGMGVDCHLSAGHDGWHAARHETGGDVGYPFAIQWPRNEHDRCAPAASQDTPGRDLIDASNVVNLHGATRCTGCNSVDQWWCSCPDGYTPPAASQDTAETADTNGEQA